MWVIVRTEPGKELAVSRQIALMDCEAWVPMEVRFHRIGGNAKSKRRTIWEAPVIPGCLFAAVPVALHGDLQAIRGYHSLHRPDPLSAPYFVSDNQITAFRNTLERENTIKRRQFARAQEGKRANKRLKVKLDEQGFAYLMKELFGLDVEMKEAA